MNLKWFAISGEDLAKLERNNVSWSILFFALCFQSLTVNAAEIGIDKDTSAASEPTFASPEQAKDSDSDGVDNAQDACPFDGGLVKSNGCPIEIEIEVVKKVEPSPVASSNQFIGDLGKSDCTFVFNNPNCARILLMPKEDTIKILGQANSKGQYLDFGYEVSYIYDTVLGSITFKGTPWEANNSGSPFKGLPAKGLNWNSSINQVISVLGAPDRKTDFYGTVSLEYGLYSFSFINDELVWLTHQDTAAFQKGHAEHKNVTPTNNSDAKQKQTIQEEKIVAEYDRLFDTIKNNVDVANNLIKEIKADAHLNSIGIGLGTRKYKEDQVNKIQNDSNKLIDAYLTKYSGQLPDKVLQAVNALRAKVNAGGIRD